MKALNICHHDTQGLGNDALVLANKLKNEYYITITKYPETILYSEQQLPEWDIRVFLEHASISMMTSKFNVFIPNIEWMNARDIQCAQAMNLIVAKTRHAYVVLKERFPKNKVVYWGWSSIDRSIPHAEPNYGEFLHVKGVSRFKNTQLVLETWLKHPEWPMLTLLNYGDISRNDYVDIPVDHFMVAENVRVIQRKTTNDELNEWMNRCGVHICASNMEGFGHYINEALSVRALVVTTCGEPMKQFVKDNENGFLIPTVETKAHALGTHYTLDTNGFETAIQRVMALTMDERREFGNRSRALYEIMELKPTKL
jgi:glycosyltransferase involved in cell wall biosynthesis